jgi:hypothetical protein
MLVQTRRQCPKMGTFGVASALPDLSVVTRAHGDAHAAYRVLTSGSTSGRPGL